MPSHRSGRPPTSQPRPVVVLDAIAGELLRVLMLGLKVRATRSGTIASPRLVDLLRALDAADHRHMAGAPQPNATGSGTVQGGPVIVDAEELTVEDAASVMGCTPGWVRALYRSGRLRGRRAGQRTLLIDRTSVDTHRYRERTS